MKVTTNNVRRHLASWQDLPTKVQAEFDYIQQLGECARWQPRLVKYLGEWYDIYDSQSIQVRERETRIGWAITVTPDHPLAAWHSVITESHFSGILFRVTQDDDVVVGRYAT